MTIAAMGIADRTGKVTLAGALPSALPGTTPDRRSADTEIFGCGLSLALLDDGLKLILPAADGRAPGAASFGVVVRQALGGVLAAAIDSTGGAGSGILAGSAPLPAAAGQATARAPSPGVAIDADGLLIAQAFSPPVAHAVPAGESLAITPVADALDIAAISGPATAPVMGRQLPDLPLSPRVAEAGAAVARPIRAASRGGRRETDMESVEGNSEAGPAQVLGLVAMVSPMAAPLLADALPDTAKVTTGSTAIVAQSMVNMPVADGPSVAIAAKAAVGVAAQDVAGEMGSALEASTGVPADDARGLSAMPALGIKVGPDAPPVSVGGAPDAARGETIASSKAGAEAEAVSPGSASILTDRAVGAAPVVDVAATVAPRSASSGVVVEPAVAVSAAGFAPDSGEIAGTGLASPTPVVLAGVGNLQGMGPRLRSAPFGPGKLEAGARVLDAEPRLALDRGDVAVPQLPPALERPAPQPALAVGVTLAEAASGEGDVAVAASPAPAAARKDKDLPVDVAGAALAVAAPIGDATLTTAPVRPAHPADQQGFAALAAAAVGPASNGAAPVAVVPAAPIVVLPVRPESLAHDVGLALAQRLGANGEELRIRLEPADFGTIDIRMSFDHRGALRAVVGADSSIALDLLRRDSADLGRALSDAGVRSDAQSFRFESRSDGRGDGGQHQQQRPTPPTWAARADEAAIEIPDPMRFRPLRWRGAIDVTA